MAPEVLRSTLCCSHFLQERSFTNSRGTINRLRKQGGTHTAGILQSSARISNQPSQAALPPGFPQQLACQSSVAYPRDCATISRCRCAIFFNPNGTFFVSSARLVPREAGGAHIIRRLLDREEAILCCRSSRCADVLCFKRVMETWYSCHLSSPVGPLFLAASGKGLARLEFEARVMRLDSKAIQLRESKQALAPYLRELDEYFAGERREFSIPLDLRGTDFQLKCWRALLKIPYGETRTYGDIARAVGHPQAFRAVGMSNNRNPVAIVVPCHRVIASGGSLCGYGGGLDIKRKLLDLEKAHVHPSLPLGIGA